MLNYIDGPEVKITQNDGIFVDVEFYFTKEKFIALEPHKLFPKSGGGRYIALQNEEGEQIAIIRNIDNLDNSSKEAVEAALDEYYLVPTIKRFIKMSEKFGIWIWTVETDRGIISFEIRNHVQSVKPLYDGRVLIKDANDNRYEIPNYLKMDKQSIKMLEPKL